ncbi:radical SAM protein [Candidatus Woesearchaeota archaeon]|nr:radical SAM protein [Candidatus Woesearchaeota archaeon]
MRFVILDCYTDEPSGLGVPPYIGTYPRYLYGSIIKNNHEAFYITIDDLRNLIKPKKTLNKNEELITDIKRYNLTRDSKEVEKLLSSCDYLILNSGVQTPGKYLSAYPGTVKESIDLISELENNSFITILSGPGAEIGEGLYGGKKSTSRSFDNDFDYVIKDLDYKFDELIKTNFKDDFVLEKKPYSLIRDSSILGASLVKQIPDLHLKIAEIETMRGCKSKTACSFCTEKLKNSGAESRPIKDILDEIKALSEQGVENFRLGKQTCIYSYGSNEQLEKLLSGAKKYAKILHLDNVNPSFVTEEKTKTICKYTTEGNIAAFGVESFDDVVIKKNNLNTNPEESFEAIKIINKYGNERGSNGMPKFLPGLNLLFGLEGESKKTHEANMLWLNKILDEDLLLRRINIREVVVFENTPLDKSCGVKYLKKNKKYYWKWRDEIRQNIDIPMLKKLVPKDTILNDVITEIYDGNTTFARQIGTYPLAIGIRERIPLGKKISIKVDDYMKRSIVGKKI